MGTSRRLELLSRAGLDATGSTARANLNERPDERAAS
jgi:hypothetical protein